MGQDGCGMSETLVDCRRKDIEFGKRLGKNAKTEYTMYSVIQQFYSKTGTQ